MPIFRMLLILVVMVSLTAGCASTPGGVAASNIPLDQGGYTVLNPVRVGDCKINLFGILPVSGGNYVDDAIDKAIRKSNADALIDIRVDMTSKFFFLWSQRCTTVSAKGVRIN